jgi:acetyl-CoA carboxylase biotin carboxyl carrier protein
MPLDPPDIRELKAIVDWVNLTHDVRELSIRIGDVELFVSRDGRRNGAATAPTPAAAPAAVAPAAAPAVAAPAPAAAVGVPGPGAQASVVDRVESETFSADMLAADEVLITAPMIGTFYACPKPGDPPFVSVGATVGTATVVGIVEVMKLMNNLEAKVEGQVARILVENEQAVEFGQPLMVITRHG